MDVKVGEHLDVVYSIEASKALCFSGKDILIISIQWSHFDSSILTRLSNSTSIVLWSNVSCFNSTYISHWLQGKVTIITGSAQGLGKAFAIRLLGAGAKVPCIRDLKPFAIKKMFRAFSIVLSGLPVRCEHRGG